MIIFLILSLSTDFADFLFHDGDYFRAITEYKRVMDCNNSIDTGVVMKKIGLSYAFLGEYASALPYISVAYQFKGDEDTKREYVWLLLMSKKWDEVEMLTEGDTDTLIMIYRGVAFTQNGNLKKGRKILSQLLPGRLQIQEGNVNRFISYFIPGSGQIVLGEFRRGFMSMIINFGFGYFTYRSISGKDYINAFMLGTSLWKFYEGNIKLMNSIIKKKNEEKIKKILEKCKPAVSE
jgi:tetratricopeptide (TPR) repeat protein